MKKSSDGRSRVPLLEVDGHGLPLFSRGEVHDTFDLGNELLVVATDRVGVNGVILPDGIPDKGTSANLLSRRWFERTAHLCPNHLAPRAAWPSALKHERAALEPRSLVVRKAKVVPFECTVRGYMTRRAFDEYLHDGTVGGKPAPGVLRSGKLPEPRLVPTKRAAGTRTQVTVAEMASEIGTELASTLEALSLALYAFAEEQARPRDVIIAQSTFRFGFIDDKVHLVGECLTPDSSSYWTAEARRAGAGPTRLGKGFLLETLAALGWDGSAPGPSIPPEAAARVQARYVDAYARITGDHKTFA